MLKKMKFYLANFIKTFILTIKLLMVSVIPEKRKKIQKYPKTIQLSITYKCNLNCVMCEMKDLVQNKDFTYKELDQMLSDKVFKNVTTIQLNGGEPFLKQDIVDCIKVMTNRLKKLKAIHIISNGYVTNNILKSLEQIYSICKKKNIKIHISFSVDGINEMQDFMRGTKNAWVNVNKTIDSIKANQNKYCDTIGIITTITKYNIYNIEEVELWAQEKALKVAYNIATVNAKIDNYNKLQDFTIFNDEKARMCTQEFFYKKFIEEKSKRYFGIYLFIHEQKRYAPCACQTNSWVTLTPNSQISYCATYSDELGSALDESTDEIVNGNIEYLNKLIKKNCETCSHYIYTLSKDGRKKYYQELLRNQKVMY